MKLQNYVVLLLIFSSCSRGLDLKPIPLDPLFHDMNSKVWMIDQVVVNGKNYAPKLKMEKDILVFYASGKCLFQPLKSLGHFVGKRGEFSIYTEEKNLSLYFDKEIWDFTIAHLSEDTIILDPTKNSDLKYQMVLVPFPEF